MNTQIVNVTKKLQMKRAGKNEWGTMNQVSFTTGDTIEEVKAREAAERSLLDNRDRWSRLPDYADCSFRIV